MPTALLRRATLVAVLVAMPFLVVGDASGCCMVPMSWKGDVDQAGQQGIVLYAAGHEELIVRVQPFFQDAPDTPAYLEWVLTVPSTPTGYATVPQAAYAQAADLVTDLERRAIEQEKARSRWEHWSLSRESKVEAPARAVVSASMGLQIAPPVVVGPYEITAVKARGKAALEELNAYLATRGFPQEDADHMRYFVERQFTFLCIHITPPTGQASLGQRLDLEALRVGFESERPYYPAKFSSRQGAFSLELTTVTDKPLSTASIGAISEKLRARTTRWANLWTVKPLPEAVRAAAVGQGGSGDEPRWYVNPFHSRGFNTKDEKGVPAISKWTEDVFFDLGSDADEPPSWYYGDRDIGFLETMWREHRIAIGVYVAVVLLAVVWWRRRRARAMA